MISKKELESRIEELEKLVAKNNKLLLEYLNVEVKTNKEIETYCEFSGSPFFWGYEKKDRIKYTDKLVKRSNKKLKIKKVKKNG